MSIPVPGIRRIIVFIQCKMKTLFIQMAKSPGDIKIELETHHRSMKAIREVCGVAALVKSEIYSINSNPFCHCKFVSQQFNDQIFNDISLIFCTFSKQFDTKSCILRMICEAKHYLLPPGKSLFHDIFRVLFT